MGWRERDITDEKDFNGRRTSSSLPLGFFSWEKKTTKKKKRERF